MWKNGEMSYLAILEEDDVNISLSPPKESIDILMEYEDIMPTKLSKKLPTKMEVDH